MAICNLVWVINTNKMASMSSSIKSIFEDAQYPMQARSKLVARLQKMQDNAQSDEEFFEPFSRYLKHSMVVIAKEPKVERTIDFVVAFATSESKAQRSKEEEVSSVRSEIRHGTVFTVFTA